MEKDQKQRKRLNSKVNSFTPNQDPQVVVDHNFVQKNLVHLVKILNSDYKFQFLFPRLNDYSNLQQVTQSFECLKECNKLYIDVFKFSNFICLMMIADTLDDVHKAVKYGVWNPKNENFEKIDQIYKENKKVLLCFRVQSQNIIVGIAEMTSLINPEPQYDIWWNGSAKGYFQLKWIFIKNLDIQFLNKQCSQEKNLQQISNAEIISRKSANNIFKQFQKAELTFQKTIFWFFKLFDQREDQLYKQRRSQDVQIKLQKKQKKKTDNNFVQNKRRISWKNNKQNNKYSNKDHNSQKYRKKQDDCAYIKKINLIMYDYNKDMTLYLFQQIQQSNKFSQNNQEYENSKEYWLQTLDCFLDGKIDQLLQKKNDYKIKIIQFKKNFIYQISQENQKCLFVSQNQKNCSCQEFFEYLIQGLDIIYVYQKV